MLFSGDRVMTATAVGDRLGLPASMVHAEATPAGKIDLVKRQQAEDDGAVVMVGDGINDAAALAQADLGIALASGTNIALESGVHRDPGAPGRGGAADDRDRPCHAPGTIRQNLFFAFVYNVSAILPRRWACSACTGLIIAAIAMAGSDLTVIGNALRARRGSLATRARAAG